MNYPLLDALKSPADLKPWSVDKLKALAQDLRHRIQEVVQETGGHLGPNLGAVEIIIACHVVFDLDRDRLVFDVGHQAYAHKLLTGRHRDFTTLRQKNGVSGYPHQGESPYDVFRSGHASTAISTSVGILEGLLHSQAPSARRVIALVGDGSLTGGMAFEGMNHAGHLKRNLIVILNDNRMSISPTVGALSAYFNKLRHHKGYNHFRNEIMGTLKKIPAVGSRLEEAASLVLDSARRSVIPGKIFTDLGFDYQGPFSGHDLKTLITVLNNARTQARGPILIHVLTDKGKGYKPEGREGREILGPHALGPGVKKPAEGPVVKPKPSYGDYFVKHFIRLAKGDGRVVGITAAMADGTGIEKCAKEFPDRCYDVGICEQHATGFSAGLASAGRRPIFAVYSTFLQRGFDQIFHDIVLQGKLPVMFCIDRGGLVGDDGPSHHGVYDIAYLRIFPGFVCMAPKDGEELGLMMEFGLTQEYSSSIRYPKEAAPEEGFFGKCAPLSLGKPEILRQGEKLCFLAYGAMNLRAVEAAKILEGKGIRVTVANGRFAKPVDAGALRLLAESHRHLVTLEDGVLPGGYGSAVLEVMEREGMDVGKVVRLGIPDRLVEHASRSQQLAECGLDPASLVKKAETLLGL